VFFYLFLFLKPCDMLTQIQNCNFVLLQYRIMLNGFGYAMFGVPTSDLETTWKSECTTPPVPGQLPLLFQSPEPTTWSVSVGTFVSARFTSCMMCLLLAHELYGRHIEWYLHLLMMKNYGNNSPLYK
jgi:hypothetical protein